MQAAVVHDFDHSSSKRSHLPGAGEIVVRIEAFGLCQTEVQAPHASWPPTRGHEAD
ncbi:MAG: hypothetical protein K0S64_182 [Gaiellaceae bacterium]|jgi:D-arabinose 1-dehydrogenase-like Zn-dependent alcohol dehydrogenase|nr:hypothetical protein [Gaiellaceae bacterium]